MIAMFDPVSLADIRQVISGDVGTKVTLQMPAHMAGREVQQDPTRLKNLVEKAIELLDDWPVANPLEFMSSARDRIHDSVFWQHQGNGLVVLIDEQQTRWYRLPQSLGELVVVGDDFHVGSLVAQAASQRRFWTLSLDWDQARLFHGTQESLEEIRDDDFPARMDQIVTPRDTVEQLQRRSYRMPGQAARREGGAVLHGQGEGEGKIAADRELYLMRVGSHLEHAMYNAEAPWVLLATAEVRGHFLAQTDLEPTAFSDGSPTHLDEDAIRSQSVSLLTHIFERDHEQLREDFGMQASRGLGSEDIEDILRAALAGRVDTLYFDPSAQLWGRYDAPDDEVRRDRERRGDSTDLINTAIVTALRTGSRMAPLPQAQMPTETSPIAATFRY
jgi:hypothetical protein